MNKNIIWTGRKYQSTENCCVVKTNTGFEVNSIIIGIFNDKIVRLQYMIVTNNYWQTTSFHIAHYSDGKKKEFLYQSDAKGNWKDDNGALTHLNGCIDIDISLTPFTNTLPIKRLQLKQYEKKEVTVLYIDMLTQVVRKMQQQYTRIDQEKVLYQNVENDFEAILQVDDHGLIIDYPGIFKLDKIENR